MIDDLPQPNLGQDIYSYLGTIGYRYDIGHEVLLDYYDALPYNEKVTFQENFPKVANKLLKIHQQKVTFNNY